jgi:DHA2 family multidrug resistance protein
LIGLGLGTTSLGLIHMTTFTTNMDYKYAMLARCYQAVGFAFLFVPINTAAYAFVPRNKNNAASGLINLARNVGGSVGISLVTTLLSRRTQFHQARLVENASALNPDFNKALHGFGQIAGLPGGPNGSGSYALLMRVLQRQAETLSYVDCFWLLGIAFGAIIPLVFVMKKNRPGKAAMAH